MAAQKEQSFKNHARLDPPFHFFVAPVALASLVIAIVHAVQQPSPLAFWWIIVGLAAFVLVFKTRAYALKAQDRVIRLEERLRHATVLPEALRVQSSQLKDSQLVGLRFAPDDELPDLVRRSLSENLPPKAIKQAIRQWRADHHRV